jgi:alpha-glucosidase
MRFLDSVGEVLCFERSIGDERLICVFNLGHDAAPWEAPGGFTVIEQVNPDAATAGLLQPMAGLVLASGPGSG